MIEIIPAIDIIDGRCVRLRQGDYNAVSSYNTTPLDIAKGYEGVGIRRLHLVDLDGAKASQPVNLRTLELIADATSLDIEYGGGIKSDTALRDAFNAGARRAICGSIAVDEPERLKRWLAEYGGERIILGADVRGTMVATHGWLRSGDKSIYELIDTFTNDGLQQVLCTDISKDGMLAGPAFELYAELGSRYPAVTTIASGGISSMQDIERLDSEQVRAVIVGKAIYEGRITLKELEQWLQNA